MTNGNDPAFPDVLERDGDLIKVIQHGLTKRELFAGLAMEGLLPGPNMHITNYILDDAPKQYAAVAVAMADALIAELNKPKEEK